ncbi:MAG: hypothetical protein HOP11_00395 [Saprospiraceae bacterium]|nr:hypothetical protein [Saprospiraceae bacterium]
MLKNYIFIFQCFLGYLANATNPTPISNIQFLSGATVGTEVLNLASPGQLLSSNTPFSYNILNDATAVKLVIDNGDLSEVILRGISSNGALGNASITLSPTSASGRVRLDHGFTGTVGINNPGTVNSNIMTLLFTNNLQVTDAIFNLSSLNTGGITWEYSVIQLLDATGNPFSAITSPGWTLGANGQYNVGPGAGFSGMAGVGNYISASKLTVTNVGTNTVVSGVSGPNDNLSSFGYSTVGLPPGTIVGGIRITTYLEDVRGISNGSSNFTSSILDFTISGILCPTIAAVPTLSEWGFIIFVMMLISSSSIKMMHRKRFQQFSSL